MSISASNVIGHQRASSLAHAGYQPGSPALCIYAQSLVPYTYIAIQSLCAQSCLPGPSQVRGERCKEGKRETRNTRNLSP